MSNSSIFLAEIADPTQFFWNRIQIYYSIDENLHDT